jgi:hypothetical protein
MTRSVEASEIAPRNLGRVASLGRDDDGQVGASEGSQVTLIEGKQRQRAS